MIFGIDMLGVIPILFLTKAGETFMVFFLWDRKLNQTLKIIKHSVIETYLSIWKRLICAFLMVWVCYNVPRWNNMPRWMSQCKKEGPQSRRPRAPSGSTHTFQHHLIGCLRCWWPNLTLDKHSTTVRYVLRSLFKLFILREGFTILSRLTLNLDCSPGKSQTSTPPASAS